MSRPKYPMPDVEWEGLLYRIIDGQNSDEDNMDACEAIEKIRDERAALVKMLEEKPRRRKKA